MCRRVKSEPTDISLSQESIKISWDRVVQTIPPIRDFVGTLAVAGKLFKEIEETVKKVYRDNALKKTQIYENIHKVKEGKLEADQRIFNGKRRI
jgi:hypothetical protein